MICQLLALLEMLMMTIIISGHTKKIEIGYNGNQIIDVNFTSENPVKLEKKYSNRFDRYLDPGFFQHRIHWFSIFNSFMMRFISGAWIIADLYIRMGGKNWIRQMITSSLILPTCICTMAFFINMLGRNLVGIPDFPCRINAVPRPIPEKKWYMEPVIIIFMGGILPFGSIFIEMYFVLTSFWAYKYYYVYGFMLLVFLILIVVTICVTIVCSYFLLNAEDYRWQWTSFSVGASTSSYLYLYSGRDKTLNPWLCTRRGAPFTGIDSLIEEDDTVRKHIEFLNLLNYSYHAYGGSSGLLGYQLRNLHRLPLKKPPSSIHLTKSDEEKSTSSGRWCGFRS
ncbi:TM9SF3 [Lepeophtheirus salmonis]|uniref:Transmembrane 9 superfamily member n=1 Tax=Lepeophtheirus salmonis TaxID=72036 RepID=A0A7R8H1Q7_LEPSM|nr:TM9SF3 [Lepeophtheirus salmonis]CAF2816177.1 TM9SF3 [Lepeophtheirus salmonis]